MAVPKKPRSRTYFLFLSLAALGIVFGDIGTSPLYALREALSPAHGVTLTDENVLGVLSLVFWTLTLVVSLKYVVFVLRANNEGEGGVLALMALALPRRDPGKDKRTARRLAFLTLLGLFGAALLYGDGVITPAISVLSAMEGIEVAAPSFSALVVPLTLVVLAGLFLFQRKGTATVGKLFGPITLVWFAVLAVLGIRGILLEPSVFRALSPIPGLVFLLHAKWVAFFVLGSVFLVVTGAEALYADMGHFGAGPIRFTWIALVFPALVLNYFGQGALLMHDHGALANPFFLLAPSWSLIPLLVLATLATIIASQAIITGAFSLTAQAVQLGFWPRLDVRHTSDREVGQIYVPPVNWALMVMTILVVVTFRSSGALANAYGIAVTSTMVLTSALLYVVATRRWKWNPLVAGALIAVFLAVELVFFAANILKVVEGGWFPLAIAAAILVLMLAWRDGRRLLGERLRERSVPIRDFLATLPERGYARVRGNAVYMTGNPDVAPSALVKNLEHNRVLHFQVALLSILTEDVPYVPRERRLTTESLGQGFFRVVARYGFMDEPDALEVLRAMDARGVSFPLKDTTFFLGRERLMSGKHPGMATWRTKLFGFLASNAQQATAYFRIPPDRVVEVGSQVEL